MLFSSFTFLALFLPISSALFWGARWVGLRQTVLLVSSLVFYAYWYPPYLLLLVGMVAVAWAAALLYERFSNWAAVVLSVFLLLGILALYKYQPFFLNALADAGLIAEGAAHRHAVSYALPLGISFIVFQAIGYVVDVARREIPAEKSFSLVLLFKAFFPQLIAGPICRGHELIPQLKRFNAFDGRMFANGLATVAVGVVLKVVFADNVAPHVDQWFNNATSLTATTAWGGAIGFGVQILADFWGYSTMAVGLAMMFGITIPVNFKLPYLATSLRDFWRRWHITLSFWLRDYLYKTLGGSRKGLARTFAALFMTMLLGGLWHGANYTFLIWGALHGAVLCLEHFMRSRFGHIELSGARLAGRCLGVVSTFATVFIGWVFFRADTVQAATAIIGRMFSGALHLNQLPRDFLFLVVLFFVIQVFVENTLHQLREKRRDPLFCFVLAFVCFLVSIVMSANTSTPFIYFQF
jgi:alginate O-acetyltransferase complex protein AlgI